MRPVCRDLQEKKKNRPTGKISVHPLTVTHVSLRSHSSCFASNLLTGRWNGASPKTEPLSRRSRSDCSHAGVCVAGDDGALSEPGTGPRSREEAADRHQEAGGQLSHQVQERRRAEHALHGKAGGRDGVRQQHPPQQALHLHPGNRPGDQRLGPGPAGDVRGGEKEVGHPRRARLRGPGSTTEDPRRSDAHLRGGAAQHREEIRPLMEETPTSRSYFLKDLRRR